MTPSEIAGEATMASPIAVLDPRNTDVCETTMARRPHRTRIGLYALASGGLTRGQLTNLEQGNPWPDLPDGSKQSITWVVDPTKTIAEIPT